jgi:beta-glucanase (GH16 family)
MADLLSRVRSKTFYLLILSVLFISACNDSDDDPIKEPEPVANSAPVITSTDSDTANAGTPYTYMLTATDADGDTLRLQASILPAWLTFNPATGELSGTPLQGDVGEFEVTLAASDGMSLTPLFLTISVVSDITVYEGYTLAWSDEFSDAEIDRLTWGFELGDGTGTAPGKGWGNSELQVYTDDPNNARIEMDSEGNSVLTISARKETVMVDGIETDSFTSARLTTEFLKSVRYGKIDIRAKLPEGQGFLPAIWLLGDNRPKVEWPGSGEIDMMELIGSRPDKVFSTIHYVNDEFLYVIEPQGEVVLNAEKFSDDYHLFTLDWDETSLTYSLDGTVYHTQFIEDDMLEFRRSFNIILNIAIGGNLPGSPDETTVFPQSMYVDYVRVYDQDGTDFAPPPAVVPGSETLGGPTNFTLEYLFKAGFTLFDNSEIVTFGPALPKITDSPLSINSDNSLLWSYPGTSWGGGYVLLAEPIDLTSFADGHLKFSMIKPVALADIEIKLESASTGVSLRLKDYTPVDLTDGFVEYSIPLADFVGLDLSDITIPFAMWSPIGADDANVAADIVIDDLRVE